ncbi:hypothetical protein [Lewinella sp. W8]|uniref:hypothetical protein n=1 Tax=Lewinella sp. W8 TaxID=2528208 RepID=UPI00106824AE|nr:hypothetical protein [Lewinella sp. W8]MTB51114.1 hypothetical protein [Lewinella sp. W8]
MMMRLLALLALCASLSTCATLKTLTKDFGTVSKDVTAATGDLKHLTEDIRSVRENVLPLDTISKQLIQGVLDKLSEDSTQNTLEVLIGQINQLLADLNTAQVGGKLSAGLIDSLTSARSQRRLDSLLLAVTQSAGNNLDATVKQFLVRLNSRDKQAEVDKLLASLLSARNRSRATGFLDSILAGVNFRRVGTELTANLVSDSLRSDVDSLVRTSVRAILEEVDEDDGLWSNLKSILLWAAAIIGIAIAVLIWFLSRRNRRVNKFLVREIEALSKEGEGYEGIKTQINQKAIDEGVKDDLDAVLKRMGLKDEE